MVEFLNAAPFLILDEIVDINFRNRRRSHTQQLRHARVDQR